MIVKKRNSLSTDVPRIRRTDGKCRKEKDGRRKIKYKSFGRNSDVVIKYIYFNRCNVRKALKIHVTYIHTSNFDEKMPWIKINFAL